MKWMMMNPDFQKIAEILKNETNFLIFTHERPDGDALGSVFAMLNCLRENGKRATAYLPENLPGSYLDFVPGDFRSELSLLEAGDFSYALCLDTSNPERAGLGGKFKVNDLINPVLNIDHHPDNKSYGKFNYIDSNAAAAAEIIFKLLKAAKLHISAKTATLLLLGVIMDTGGFRFDNTKAHVLRNGAELLELGADHHSIIKNMFFSKPLNYMQFEADLVSNNLKIECCGRFAYINIPHEKIRKYNIDMRNTEGLIECVRAINGMEVVALMIKCDVGYKISLRSKNPLYSVGQVARRLSGGGHELAAGCYVKNNDPEES